MLYWQNHKYLFLIFSFAAVMFLSSFSLAFAAPPPRGQLETVGEQKTLVLLVNFQNSVTPPVTSAQARELVFNGQFQKFYREQSYGRIHFKGDVRGWYTLPRPCIANHTLWPNWSQGDNEVARIISENNVNVREYDRLVVLVDCPGHENASLGKIPVKIGDREYRMSVATVPVWEVFLNVQWSSSVSHPFELSVTDYYLIRAMGQNLGLERAKGLDCGERTLPGNRPRDCYEVEAGNNFDAMGYGFTGLHFNALYKDKLGWVPERNQLTITRPGRYTINVFETGADTRHDLSKKFAKIVPSQQGARPLYLEYRKGIGFDRALNNPGNTYNQEGLMVNQAVGSYSRLLDMYPTELPWDDDLSHATLNVGQIFRDRVSGVVIETVAPDAHSVTFDVRFGQP